MSHALCEGCGKKRPVGKFSKGSKICKTCVCEGTPKEQQEARDLQAKVKAAQKEKEEVRKANLQEAGRDLVKLYRILLELKECLSRSATTRSDVEAACVLVALESSTKATPSTSPTSVMR